MPDRLVDSIPCLRTNAQVLRREPAADAFVLEVSVQPFGRVLVFAGVTDEARIKFDGLLQQRG
jgi:hypothetical protein